MVYTEFIKDLHKVHGGPWPIQVWVNNIASKMPLIGMEQIYTPANAQLRVNDGHIVPIRYHTQDRQWPEKLKRASGRMFNVDSNMIEFRNQDGKRISLRNANGVASASPVMVYSKNGDLLTNKKKCQPHCQFRADKHAILNKWYTKAAPSLKSAIASGTDVNEALEKSHQSFSKLCRAYSSASPTKVAGAIDECLRVAHAKGVSFTHPDVAQTIATIMTSGLRVDAAPRLNARAAAYRDMFLSKSATPKPVAPKSIASKTASRLVPLERRIGSNRRAGLIPLKARARVVPIGESYLRTSKKKRPTYSLADMLKKLSVE